MEQLTHSLAVENFLRTHKVVHALPESSVQLIQALADPDCDSEQLLNLIEKDPALAGSIMKCVNSAYYALPVKMTRLDRAVAYLGLQTTKGLAVSSSVSKMVKWVSFGKYKARDLWDHSIAVAITSRELAIKSRGMDGEEAFLLGILHDIGLLLAAQSEQEFGAALLTRADANEASFAKLEQRIFGLLHSELGGALASNWGFQESHAAAIQFHHNPELAPDEFKLFSHHLYVADTIACRTHIGCPLTGKGQPLDQDHLDAAGITQDMVETVTNKLPLLARLYLS
jgi:HD-like signal output (HDOD) protein